MRRPLAVTAAGVGIGLALVLPLAREQLATTAPAQAVVAAVPGTGSAAGRSTVTGPSIATRYGPVQVQLVMTGDRITSATAVQLPSGDRESRRINASAGPVLNREAVAAQSAHIDTVSGASYTSDGYTESLQAALDAARGRTLSAQGGS